MMESLKRREEAQAQGQTWRSEEDHISLCEAIDRVLNTGVVVHGDLTISVANIDLVYVGLRLLLASAQTAEDAGAMLPGVRILDDLQRRDRRGGPRGNPA